MDTIVLYIAAIEAALVGEILTELLINVLGADAPAILTVDGIPKAGRIDNGQTQSDAALLNVHGFLFDARCLLDAILHIGHLAILVEITQK